MKNIIMTDAFQKGTRKYGPGHLDTGSQETNSNPNNNIWKKKNRTRQIWTRTVRKWTSDETNGKRTNMKNRTSEKGHLRKEMLEMEHLAKRNIWQGQIWKKETWERWYSEHKYLKKKRSAQMSFWNNCKRKHLEKKQGMESMKGTICKRTIWTPEHKYVNEEPDETHTAKITNVNNMCLKMRSWRRQLWRRNIRNTKLWKRNIWEGPSWKG